MTRLLVHVEGQTEEEFVREVLAPHLYGGGFTSVSARLVGRARMRKKRGGICAWHSAHTEIARHLTGDQEAFGTTLVDYYALPADENTGWPGRADCEDLTVSEKAKHIQASLLDDFRRHHGEAIANRFIPFVAMYEFEGLLFSDPRQMAHGMGEIDMTDEFQAIRDAFESPEHINDSPQTAPSKRIQKLVPSYNKVLHGNIAAIDVTLDCMRKQCPIFSAWLEKIESLT
ncbi:uncharacterized protein DUF4276 [Maritalea mobilis]|uniref:Uncharacterized protein DUF4276 n=1 Tax=Maritalea mobilis TaxID=483324 RepID=A0A4R6VUJ5_9HYPH|nr:DUF4276 family protein [Maritalea mobilis]TDQ63891.1 uncharacterized protein DUF4276 [Maritalea mobilis]